MSQLTEPEYSNLVVTDSNGYEYVCTSLSVTESVSGISNVIAHIQVSSGAPSSWIGSDVECAVYTEVGSGRSVQRQFKGYVVAAKSQSQMTDSSYFMMALTVQPWIGLLAYSKSCRVFQDKTVQAIVASIFDELGFSGQYSVNSMPSSTREYCVQFNETDLDFVLRLLSEEGVHFYYGKDSDSSKLILQDASKPFSSDDAVSLDHIASPSGDNETADKWEYQNQFHSASLEVANFNYSQSKLMTSKASSSKYSISGNTKFTEYRYPTASGTGDYADLSAALVTVQRAQLDSGYSRVYGETKSVDLAAGFFLDMASHPDDYQEGKYLIIELEHLFETKDGTSFKHQTEFVGVPEDSIFYPAYRPKPVVHGLQSALVSGQTDDEPSCDVSGRLRVKFHWDAETGDETSCYVRVAQPMAGNGYGFQFLPRAGHEVLVSFINGDPDQPVIVSSVYNSNYKPPYATASTTQSGIKTKLAGEANELRFDDKKDNESFYMHAAKDFLHEVVNDHIETIAGEKKTTVTKSITEAITEKYTLSSKDNMALSTEKAYTLNATNSIAENSKAITLTATDTLKLVVGDSKIEMSGDSIKITSSSITLNGDSAISLSGGSIKQSGSSVSIRSDGSVSVKSGSSMSLSAGSSLSAKASSSLTAKGLNATLEGSVGATVKGSASAEISSSGSTTVKGSIVMVN